MPHPHRAPRDPLISAETTGSSQGPTAEPPSNLGGSVAFRAGVAAAQPAMPILIGLAHGSRHPQVAAGVQAVLAAVTAQAGITTRAAYLDLTAPDLEQVTRELATAGVRRAVVVPLLFTDAFHARVDVPTAISDAAAMSGVELLRAPILGTADDVVDVVAERLADAGSSPAEPVLLFAVGSSRPEANAAVADLAARLAARRGAPVHVGFGTSAPRARDVLTEVSAASGPGTVVPLFVAPGLLLDAIAPAVTAAGWRLAAPLGPLLAPLVAQRYHAVAPDHDPLR